MNLAEYLRLKAQPVVSTRRQRLLCFKCLQPQHTCYCTKVRPFDPLMKFIILIHKLELRRRIATGRMSHLCLHGSDLISGHDFSQHATLNGILADPNLYPVILYPGRGSTNLTPLSSSERAALFPADKRLAVIVLDGTWSTARKMLKHSRNLIHLPRIGFIPPAPSNFRVRKQPKVDCYSTIEAIHHLIELLGSGRGFDVASGAHHSLISVFDNMVEQQLRFIRESRKISRHRRSEPAISEHPSSIAKF